MRFDRLRLLAFGPFTDLEIDLAGCATGLHLLYGDNAAGKSTTLRAVRGLLYGIPHDTQDAHRHRTSDLRIGATLRGVDGTRLDVVRRKGHVRTLLDPSGAPIDEAPLLRLLGGVGEQMFGSVFGLDHDALRRGGDALLSGGGDVAESLFEAGSGAGGLHALLEELRAEMEALWTPQAHKRPLAEAIARFREAHKTTRADALSHETWAAQERALAETRAEHERVVAERREAELRRRWLERARRVRPSLARRRQWLAERAAIGEVPALGDGAVEERRQAQRDLEAAQAALVGLDDELADVERQLAALAQGTAATAAAPEGTAAALGDRAARRRALLDELTRRRVEHERLLEGVAQRVAKLGAAATAAPLDLAAQATLRELAGRHRVLADRSTETDRRAADSGRRSRASELRRATLGAPRDVGALERSLARARELGDAAARLASTRAALGQLEQAARVAAAGLSPWTGTSAAALQLVPPDPSTIGRFAAEAAEQEARARGHDAERDRARARARVAQQAIAEIEGEGRVPTEEDLADARRARDESWGRVRAAWAAGDAAAERRLGGEHELRAHEADEIADRLRREAGRVTRVAVLRAEREAARAEELAVQAAREADAVTAGELQARWCAAWAGAGFEPLPPAAMKEWSARHERVVELEGQRVAAARQVADLEERLRVVTSDLEGALEAVAPSARPRGASVAALVDAAEALVLAERDRARQVEAADEALAAARSEHEALGAEREAHVAVVAAWRCDWAKAVGELSLAEDVAPDVALEILEALRDLWARSDEAASAERSALHTAAAVETLTREIRDVVLLCAPDLAHLDTDDAVRRLVARLEVAEEEARVRGDLERRQVERAGERDAARAAAANATSRLEALRVAAGARDLADLERVEQRWAAAARVDRQLAENAAQLLEVGEGASVEELEQTYASLDADRLAAELGEIEARLPALEERASDLDYRARGIEAGREHFPGDLRVVRVAEDAQGHLARVRELARRWARLRLASVVLSREIEQYRQKNQGPVLGRASELFRRLSAPDFRGLRAGWSSSQKDRLECLKADGAVVEVGELSDGERDALYLALRLASLERALETTEPIPLVLDDVLIQMDDRHVRAALQVLAEVAQRTQVLFFTHNEHIVSIARAALGERSVCVHRLAQGEPARVAERPA